MSTVQVYQGSQPFLGDLQVGVVVTGVFDGVGRARLLVRSPLVADFVDLAVGESIALPHGTLRLDEVMPGQSEGERDLVTLTLLPEPG